MTPRLTCLALWSARMGLVLVCAAASAEEANRVQIHTDFAEGDASLAILNERHAGQPPTDAADADWELLFSTEPYQRLNAPAN
jgi:hypothetical protein